MNYRLILLNILSLITIAASAQSYKYWVAADLSENHILAVRNDGTLWAKGKYNILGELGNGTYSGEKRSKLKIKNRTERYKDKTYRKENLKFGDENRAIKEQANNNFIQVGTDVDWKEVWTMSQTSLALKTDSTLWAWGDNDYGILGDSIPFNANHPNKVGKNKWLKIAVGARHVVALRSDSTLWTWGDNEYGQLGDGSNRKSFVPQQVRGSTKWRDVAAGAWFSAGITADGEFIAWGDVHYEPILAYTQSFAQTISLSLLIDAMREKDLSKYSNSSQKWTKLAAGDYHTMMLNDKGELWTMGTNMYGQLGDSTKIPKKDFIQIGKSNRWIDIAPFGHTSNALDKNNEGWTWGKNLEGGSISTPTLQAMKDGSSVKWKRLVRGGAIDMDNNLWSWRYGSPLRIDCPQQNDN